MHKEKAHMPSKWNTAIKQQTEPAERKYTCAHSNSILNSGTFWCTRNTPITPPQPASSPPRPQQSGHSQTRTRRPSAHETLHLHAAILAVVRSQIARPTVPPSENPHKRTWWTKCMVDKMKENALATAENEIRHKHNKQCGT